MHSAPIDDPFVQAASWVLSLVTGTPAMVFAVLAIAAVGFAMMGGRIDWRRGGRVIIGCFILFSAGIIGKGLADLLAPNSSNAGPEIAQPQYVPAKAPQKSYDPYDGAAVPDRSKDDLLN